MASFPANERIRQILKQLRLNESGLAKSIGCKPQAINNIVNDKNKPGFGLITSILVSHPTISTDWLVLGNGEMMKSEVSAYRPGDTLRKIDDPAVKIFGCKDCIEKEKVIVAQKITIEACRETIKLQREKIEYIEGDNGKNEKVHCG